MFTEDALGVALAHQVLDQPHNSWRVGAAVNQITDEAQLAAFWMSAIAVVTQPIQQFAQSATLAVYVADDVDWPRKELLYKPHDVLVTENVSLHGESKTVFHSRRCILTKYRVSGKQA